MKALNIPATTTATTLATDGADVFSALITDLTSAVSSETLIYQQARVTGWISSNELQQRGKSDLIRTKVTANAGAKICVIFRRYQG